MIHVIIELDSWCSIHPEVMRRMGWKYEKDLEVNIAIPDEDERFIEMIFHDGAKSITYDNQAKVRLYYRSLGTPYKKVTAQELANILSEGYGRFILSLDEDKTTATEFYFETRLADID